MVIPELKKYIEEASNAGLNEEEIIINLLNAGWDVEDVNKAVKDIEPKESIREPKKNRYLKSKTIISYVLIAVGILLILLTIYMSRSFIKEMDNYFALNGNMASVSGVSPDRVNHDLNNNNESTLLFVGDIMLSKNRGVGKQIKKYQNTKYPFLKIADKLKSADITFGNLEGPISSRGKDMGGRYSFRAEPRVIEGLRFAGFDIMSIANNHIFDWGEEAFDDTLLILRSNDIDAVGGGINYTKANIPIIKNVNGTKIAFLAYSTVDYDINAFNAEEGISGKSSFNLGNTKRAVKRIKELGIADIVAVSFHWGEEYKTRSNIGQQNIARTLIESGADMIIGHHPHVVQEIERYKGGWIVYSLGNFVFDQSFSEETMRGLMVEVKVDNKSKTISSIDPIDIEISETFQPKVL